VYEQILKYWRDGRDKPAANEAYKGLMQLAANTNIKSNIVHHDVIDAMIRQPSSTATRPFAGNRLSKSITINAAGYDMGRNGYAYFDNDTANYYISTGGQRTAGNRGGAYRNDGVDIKAFADGSGNFVTHIEDGEWLQYTVNVAAKGVYNVNLKVACDTVGTKVSVLNGKDYLTHNIVLPNTSAAGKWQLVKVAKVRLDKGENKLRILANKGGFDLAEIQLGK
ncbi:MAG: carbohydrate-binding protein, partial [Sphingobacteriales bacterium]